MTDKELRSRNHSLLATNTPQPDKPPTSPGWKPPRQPDWLLILMSILFLCTLLIAWLVSNPNY